MTDERRVSRRTTFRTLGALGAGVLLSRGASEAAQPESGDDQPTDVRREIFARVRQTTFIDTHEHLPEEATRLPQNGQTKGPDDWSVLLAGYLGSDLRAAGMPNKDWGKFFSKGPSPIEKWKVLEPYWMAVKNTGYGLAARISIRELYGVDELSAQTVDQVQAGYEKLRRPGFYREILCERSKIESCQVNSMHPPFIESAMPKLLMQDISIVGMFAGPDFKTFGERTGIKVSCLTDWHKVIDWWLAKYAKYAVAVKSQNAYSRDLDYEQIPDEKAEGIFKKKLDGADLSSEEQKALEDHLFWYAVQKATETDLPVKLHTGYYAGANRMPLSRLIDNAGSACDLCRAAPETTFVFMHICYPYYEELLAAAKQYTNAVIDMCWAWIINPIAAKDFLKKYLVTAPANKIVTFGGDYFNVEQVLGHAVIAREGIALALSELVEEGWLSLDDALELIDPIMRGNARRIFRLDEKEKALSSPPWT